MTTPILYVKRDGTKVILAINSKLNTSTPWYHFEWNAVSENHAVLLQARLETVLEDEMRAIREEMYAAGYRDGRAKRAKRTWFSNLIRRDT